MKAKVALLIVCVVALSGIMLKNIFAKKVEEQQLPQEIDVMSEQKIPVVEEDRMMRAEAFRLISYLYYTKDEINTMKCDIAFRDCNNEDWFARYVYAIYNAGFTNQLDSVGGTNYIRPLDAVSSYETKLLYEYIAKRMNIELEELYRVAGVNLTNLEEKSQVSRKEFLKLYEGVLALNIEETGMRVKAKDLLLLQVDENGMAMTQEGTFQTADMRYFMEEQTDTKEEELPQLSNLLDQVVTAVTAEGQILYVRDSEIKEVTIKNVYICSGEGKDLTVNIEGVQKIYPLSAPLATKIEGMIGNLTYAEGLVKAISIKPDMVSAKVLLADEDYIELEGYGKVELDPNFKIYKVYDGVQMEEANAILVGYENTKFVLDNNMISAALVTEPIKAEQIRVLINTSKYESKFHKEVKVTSSEAFTITYGKQEKTIKAGKTVTIRKDSEYLTDGRLQIAPKKKNGKLKLVTVERACGNPEYRGVIDITKFEEGLVVVNELPLEEYLYAVIPSEMPTTYKKEALKVQAVCARSYAYNQLLENKYSKYGAHIDDSVSSQVYNNIAENKQSIAAVKDTYGQVIMYQGDVITAYYFSTSCGMTSSLNDVWFQGEEVDYLKGKLQVADTEAAKFGESIRDMSSEDGFRTFLKDSKLTTLDSEYPWYRWKVKLTYDQITKNVDRHLKERYQANPELIQVKQGEDTYVSEEIDSIGKVTGIKVLERKESGMITEILIEGTKHNVLVRSEYNIRILLAPKETTVVRQDKSKITGLTMLPSAFFVMEEKKDETDVIHLIGGGYGHGVGMSQNGVETLAGMDYNYKDIVQYYYKDVDIISIYG